MKIFALLLSLGAVGAALFYFGFSDDTPKPIEVIAAKVERRRIVETVQAVGHIEPVTQVNVSSNITGDLLKLHIKEGDTVESGQLLAQIDPERLLAMVRQSEANTRSVSAGVALEKTQLSQAKAELSRTEELHGQGMVSDADRDRARSEVSVIMARLDAAKQRVLEAKAALDAAKDQLAKTRLSAPIRGTVISLKKKVGERIRGSELAEDVLLTIAPLSAMQVEVEVSEQDVVLVKYGQDATIEIDALKRTQPDQETPGKVVEIAEQAIIRNRGTEMETTNFKVKVALNKPPPGLRSGMSASVSIVTRTKESVISVPMEAVTARSKEALAKKQGEKKPIDFSVGEGQSAQAKQGRSKPIELVFVIEGTPSRAAPRPVKTGIFSDAHIEIIEGLKEGERIIVGPYKVLAQTLEPGALVTTEKEAP